jgi:hypothetical protein
MKESKFLKPSETTESLREWTHLWTDIRPNRQSFDGLVLSCLSEVSNFYPCTTFAFTRNSISNSGTYRTLGSTEHAVLPIGVLEVELFN